MDQKLSELNELVNVPDGALLYVVVPGVGFYKTTKQNFLAGISGGNLTINQVLQNGPVAVDKELIITDNAVEANRTETLTLSKTQVFLQVQGEGQANISPTGIGVAEFTNNNDIALDAGQVGLIGSFNAGTKLFKVTFEEPATETQAIIPDSGGSAKRLAYEDWVQNQISSATVGLLDDRGNYDASSNTFPSTGGSGVSGAILKGDLWLVSVAGTLGGVPVTSGDVVRALVNSPGQTASNWAIAENNIGYVPENLNNKATTFAGNLLSNILYPSVKAVADYIASVVVSATDTVAGIMRLYGSTGSNTNGTMTQQAITTALNAKPNNDTFVQTIIIGATVGATATTFNYVTGNSAFSVTESTRQIAMPYPFRMQGLVITTQSTQPGSGNLTIELRRNGATVAGALRVINAGSAAGIYTVTFDEQIEITDLINFRFVNAAAGTSANITAVTWYGIRV